jgi:hypothetical protein
MKEEYWDFAATLPPPHTTPIFTQMPVSTYQVTGAIQRLVTTIPHRTSNINHGIRWHMRMHGSTNPILVATIIILERWDSGYSNREYIQTMSVLNP